MGIVGILLAILTVATLLYAAYVIFLQPAPKREIPQEDVPASSEQPLQTPVQHIQEVAHTVPVSASIMPYVVPDEPDVATATDDLNSVFEQYVSGKFSPQYFSLEHIKANETSGGFTGLRYTYEDMSHRITFVVECNYIAGYLHDNTICLPSERIEQYHAYFHQHKLPVFVILGVGGSADHPDKLYIIPLGELPLREEILSGSFLSKFRKFSVKSDFFLHPDLMVLR